MLWFLLVVGLLGVTTSTIYSVMVAVAAIRFLRRRSAEQPPCYLPPVSLLKALHGSEPDLERNLASFFEQDYPAFEILFCARSDRDQGIQAAKQLAARYPHVACSFHYSGEPEWPNARTYSLEVMRRAARHELLIMTDSDVRVAPDFIRKTVQPIEDPAAGMITCLYRGVTRGGLWARLEAIGMSVEMTSGVLVAEMLEGMRFALGPVMIIRKPTVSEIGGFAAIAQYHADDYVLGKWVAQTGKRVVLSTYPVEHHVMNASFRATAAHQLGWATSTRFSRPWGHTGSVLTYAIPFGILAFLCFARAGMPGWGAALLGWTILDRMLLSALVGGLVVQDRVSVTMAWLYPVRDLMGFFFWVGSYLKTSLKYRGELFEVRSGGTLHRIVKEQIVLR